MSWYGHFQTLNERSGPGAPASLVAWEAIWASALFGSPRMLEVGKEGPDFLPGMISCPNPAAWRPPPLHCSLRGNKSFPGLKLFD